MSGAPNDKEAASLSPASRPPPERVIPCAAGTTVHALKSAVLEIVGESVFRAAIADVSPQVREAFEPVTPMTWVPVDAIHLVM